MATKPNNIVTFEGAGYGRVRLVKRSLARRLFIGDFYNPLTGLWEFRRFWYYKGQLVDEWEGKGPLPMEEWGVFRKGQVVWVDANIFHIVIDL